MEEKVSSLSLMWKHMLVHLQLLMTNLPVRIILILTPRLQLLDNTPLIAIPMMMNQHGLKIGMNNPKILFSLRLNQQHQFWFLVKKSSMEVKHLTYHNLL